MDKKTAFEALARASYEKGGMLTLSFGEGCIKYKDLTLKKL
jgi:hypothetical protein